MLNGTVPNSSPETRLLRYTVLGNAYYDISIQVCLLKSAC